MRWAWKERRRGFTLTELMVVVAIFGIVAGAVLTAILTAQRTWVTGSGQAILTAQMRRAMDRMSWELSQARVSEILEPRDGQGSNRITFRIPQDRNGDGSVLDANGNIAEWSDWITYRTGQMGNRLAIFREVQPGGGGAISREVLVGNVSPAWNGLTFSRNVPPIGSSDTIQYGFIFSTTTERGETMSRDMIHHVKLRN